MHAPSPGPRSIARPGRVHRRSAIRSQPTAPTPRLSCARAPSGHNATYRRLVYRRTRPHPNSFTPKGRGMREKWPIIEDRKWNRSPRHRLERALRRGLPKTQWLVTPSPSRLSSGFPGPRYASCLLSPRKNTLFDPKRVRARLQTRLNGGTKHVGLRPQRGMVCGAETPPRVTDKRNGPAVADRRSVRGPRPLKTYLQRRLLPIPARGKCQLQTAAPHQLHVVGPGAHKHA